MTTFSKTEDSYSSVQEGFCLLGHNVTWTGIKVPTSQLWGLKNIIPYFNNLFNKTHYLQSNACFPNIFLMFEHFKLFWCVRSFSVIARTNHTALPWTARIEAVVAAVRLYTVATSWRCQLTVSILVSISTCEIRLVQTVISSNSHNCP